MTLHPTRCSGSRATAYVLWKYKSGPVCESPLQHVHAFPTNIGVFSQTIWTYQAYLHYIKIRVTDLLSLFHERSLLRQPVTEALQTGMNPPQTGNVDPITMAVEPFEHLRHVPVHQEQ